MRGEGRGEEREDIEVASIVPIDYDAVVELGVAVGGEVGRHLTSPTHPHTDLNSGPVKREEVRRGEER